MKYPPLAKPTSTDPTWDKVLNSTVLDFFETSLRHFCGTWITLILNYTIQSWGHGFASQSQKCLYIRHKLWLNKATLDPQL